MATLDDKLLGEKLHYYCSSSEDEGDSDNEGDSDDEGDSDNEGDSDDYGPPPLPEELPSLPDY